MMTRDKDKNREQVMFFSMDDMVPKDHILRLIDESISFDFIYDLVEDKYSPDFGRPSLDPVILIKIQLIQCLFGISSMRQTIKDIEVNIAYRWFLGLSLMDPVPHFTTFGKNYTRRFKDTDLYEQIFARVLEECMNCGFVDNRMMFIDATHIKAAANNHKYIRKEAETRARFYEEALKAEIEKDREEHGKKPLKNNDHDDEDMNGGEGSGGGTEEERNEKESEAISETSKGPAGKEVKESTTDPESGWFHKGEHKEVFAYCAETACDKNGWILGYTVHPGNQHDSFTFPAIYEKVKHPELEMIIADAGYKTPAIAKLLLDDGVKPLFPYKRPMTKEGFFPKYEYVYDEQYDCYLCPNNCSLHYGTTNREGYREYKSDPHDCEKCPYLSKCTLSRNHQKIVTRHVWEDYMEICEEIRHTLGMKELYQKRKETIERIFGTAKEHHNLRYTNMIGMARMKMKVGLTFTCLNLKKLAMMKKRSGMIGPKNNHSSFLFTIFSVILPLESKRVPEPLF